MNKLKLFKHVLSKLIFILHLYYLNNNLYMSGLILEK